MAYGDMLAFLHERGFSASEDGVLEGAECNQPFAWVFGRADFTVSFYGANIYPENVMVGLEQPELAGWVTGKFVMEVGESDEGLQFLHIVIELLPLVTAGVGKQAIIAQSIRSQLLRLNSEFANYVPSDRQTPQAELLPFADPAYFPSGVKHRYTRKK
jgi:phenylacetate-CoA ligase